MTTELQTQTQGKTLIMTLSGSTACNMLTPQVCAAGIEALNTAESNPDIHAVVLTGAGSDFCAGVDLQWLHHHRQHDLPAQQAAIQSLHDWILGLRAFPKPVIAAVEGRAAGAGVSLALACDAIFASREARFSMTHSRAGVSPDGGLNLLLTQALGRQRAWAIMTLGEVHEANSWANWGVVHTLTEPGQALRAALNLFEALSLRAAGAVGSIKEFQGLADTLLASHLQEELRYFMQTLHNQAAAETIEAVVDRN